MLTIPSFKRSLGLISKNWVVQDKSHADRSLYEQELQQRFRGVDKHVAAANSEALRTAADVKALNQRVSAAEWRVDKVQLNRHHDQHLRQLVRNACLDALRDNMQLAQRILTFESFMQLLATGTCIDSASAYYFKTQVIDVALAVVSEHQPQCKQGASCLSC